MSRLVAASLASGLAFTLVSCTDGSDVEPPAPTDSPSTTQPVQDELAGYYEQSLKWRECGDFECAELIAPLDYDVPSGKTIEIALLRRRADERGSRVGSLLVNPGGPGVSGISYAENSEFYFNQPILERYDIVGWDPRGVQASTPVECRTDAQIDEYLAADGTPDTAAEVRDVIRLQREFSRECDAQAGELLPHIGTFDSARDMDIIRAALNEGKTDYFGASYGTELGATYAELFPERVGRMVLDGALDPTVSSYQLAAGQLRGFNRAVSAFIDDCVSLDGCPVGPTSAQAEQQIVALLASIDRAPLATGSDRELTEALATTGMITAMYSEANGWPVLRQALANAIDGDGGILLSLADSYSERNSDGTFASNVNDAFPAISCTDRPSNASLVEIRRTIPRFERISPIFGRGFAWAGTACIDWAVNRGQFPQRLVAQGSDPIVVVGTTRDPATPYEWSVGLAEQLDAGVLLSRDGDGHTAYKAGNDCIDAAIEDYLLEGVVPEDGTEC